MIFLADMAFKMSNFDDFDNDQSHENFVRDSPLFFLSTVNFFFFFWNQDDPKNTKWNFFKKHPIFSRCSLKIDKMMMIRSG